MSLPRKKQAEIERVLKRVQEGIIEFDNIWEKVRKAATPNLKEKYEGDLKKEIKKLQRYRDQIKSWASSSEITDKRPLLQARKDVEREMERFKVLEKESKTKKYSKEGLAQSGKSVKKDPRDVVYEWIREKQDELREQIEEFEEQYERASGTSGKRKSKGKNEQLETLNHWISRHNWHIEQLDNVKSRLESREINIKQAKRIEEDLDYYIGENQEPEFVEDEFMYDAIDEDDEEDEQKAEEEEESEAEPEPEPEPEKKKEVKKEKPKPKKTPVKIVKKEEKKPIKPPAIEKKTPIKAAPKPEKKTLLETSKKDPKDSKPPQGERSRSEPAQAQPRLWGMQGGGSKPTLAEQMRANHNHQQPNVIDPKIQPRSTAVLNTNTNTTLPPQNRLVQVPLQHSKSTGSAAGMVVRGQQSSSTGMPINAGPPGGPPIGLRKARGGPEQAMMNMSHRMRKASTCLLPRKAITPTYIENLRLLESSLRQMPEALDTERPKQYVPGNPYRTPSCFPDLPAPIFDDPNIFAKFDTDTLFFIFYFQQGTQHQYLAARELKKQSWRYHKKFLTWFQRHSDPKFKNEECEQGTYVFFDYESGWCKRLKTDFTFEYCHLEDELRI
ncbi:hypothetical protein AAMO2058_000385200 [Amorphochlora amoebiformis]